jgi:DNA-binding MurR/RpiR family transcriptional regulator
VTQLKPISNKPIGQRIDSSYAELTPQEQRVADFILDNLGDLAVYNASELARLSGASKATVSRLFRRLGFENSAEVREHARELRKAGVPIGSVAPAGIGTPAGLSVPPAPSTTRRHIEAQLAMEHENLRWILDQDTLIDSAGEALAAARTVLVIGFRNSYPVALHLRQQLIQGREAVRLAPLPGQSVGEDLAGLDKRDLVVLFGFRRRPAEFADLFDSIQRRDIPLILVSDESAGSMGSLADWWLQCPVDSVSAFDSYATAMCLVNVLASRVLSLLTRAGRTRIGEITKLYDELAELEAHPTRI